MVVLIRELKRNRNSFLIWTIILAVINISMISVFPTMVEQGKKIEELIKNYPKGMIAAFGMDKVNITTILGFYNTYIYMFVTLLGSIFAALLGSIILSKEENDKTVEFLLSKPVTRNSIISSKILCTLIYITLFNLLVSIVNYLMIKAITSQDFSMRAFLLLCIGPYLMQLTFAAVGLIISVFIIRTKTIYPIAIGLTMGTYFIGIASAVTDKLDSLKYFSPFKYVDAPYIINNQRIDTVYLVIMLVVIVVSVLATYVFYNRKNIIV